MPEEKEKTTGEETPASRFPDLEELQLEIDRRIRDNRRFLERCLDDSMEDEELEGEEGETAGEEFEEL